MYKKFREKLITILKICGLYKALKALHYGYSPLKEGLFKKIFPHNTILVYHRIEKVSHDPHQLCVSPENFREQLIYLKRNFIIIPLSEMVQDLKSKDIKNGRIAITFDDGYADNLYNAVPILAELGIPATVFVTTGSLQSQKDFYWDQNTRADDRGKSMTSEEVKRLGDNPLIEIGAHTVNHPKLARISIAEQGKEMRESKRVLEEILGKKVSSFAYPFGSKDSFSKDTVREAEKAGFDFACANTQKHVFSFSNPFAIPRILARDWNGETFEKKLKLSR